MINTNEIIDYLKNLRDQYISTFEGFESKERFRRKNWDYSKGTGGGEISVIRGDVFEKAAVNWSCVSGDRFPGSEELSPFFATGVSLITHMKNPMAPTAHFNIRYIKRGDKEWLGGGYDLTPMGFKFDEDTAHFHKCAKDTLATFDVDLYTKFSEAAKEYFTIQHYNEERGVGGIFFDHYNSGDINKDIKMWKAVGDSFMDALIPIYKKRVNQDYSSEDRLRQLKYRARYVEFNLLYDRGTKFGFQSGGNPEAILCSMPPLVSW
jgi:coproporphyrinogen III oxidase